VLGLGEGRLHNINHYLCYHGSLGHPLWFERGGGVLLEAVYVGAVGGHGAVQTASSRLEALLLGLVVALDQTHEFTHAVPWSGRQGEL